ncbi:uncharacterized protein LOC134210505 [Armigeres subalbatus]|uniref:uncharacterized protein LOC134210505 n=1 Tax=Armigeres subalbatus TaxID=124917 RepID=UPI002ED13212
MSEPGMDANSRAKCTSGAIFASSTPNSLNPPNAACETTPVARGSCELCDKPDDDQMVQCDTCDVWHHFVCVGVSEDIQGCSWICLECATAKATKATKSRRKTSTQKLAVTLRKRTTRATATKGSKKVIPTTGRKHDVCDTAANGEDAVADTRRSGDDAQVATKARVSKAGSSISAASRKSVKARLDVELQQIEAEETLMQEEMRRKRELAEKKFAVLKEMADLEGSGESVIDQHNGHHKVEQWLNHRSETKVKDKRSSYKETSIEDSSEEETSGTRTKGEEELSSFGGTNCDGSEEEAQPYDERAGRRHQRAKSETAKKVEICSSSRPVTGRQHSLRSSKRLS